LHVDVAQLLVHVLLEHVRVLVAQLQVPLDSA
jgi:hypothetical protein